MSLTITFDKPGPIPVELHGQPTASGRAHVARISKSASATFSKSVQNALAQLRSGDFVIGVNGKNVERAGLVAIRSLLSTSNRPVSISFIRPVTVTFSKSGPLGLSLVESDSRVFLNAKPTGQAKGKGIEEGMCLLDLNSENVCKIDLNSILSRLRNLPRPFTMTLGYAKDKMTYSMLCTAPVQTALRTPGPSGSRAPPAPPKRPEKGTKKSIPGPPPRAPKTPGGSRQGGIIYPSAPPRTPGGSKHSGISMPGETLKAKPRGRDRPLPNPRSLSSKKGDSSASKQLLSNYINAGVPAAAAVVVATVADTEKTKSAPPPLPKHPTKTQSAPVRLDEEKLPDSILVIGLTDFQVQSMGDELNFHQGDVITISGEENVAKYYNKKMRWVKGRLQGNEGVFPKKFTKLVESPSKELRQRSPTGQSKLEPSVQKKSYAPPKTPRRPGKSRRKKNNGVFEKQHQIVVEEEAYDGPRRAFALTAFTQCDVGDELNFQAGDSIELIEDGTMDSDPAWSKGRNLRTGDEGVFPTNFVNIIDPPPKSKSRPAEQPKQEVLSASDTKDAGDASVGGRMIAVALHFFRDNSNGDELNFEKGDVINLGPDFANTGDPMWIQGELRGFTGVFPKNFVRITKTGGRKEIVEPAAAEEVASGDGQQPHWAHNETNSQKVQSEIQNQTTADMALTPVVDSKIGARARELLAALTSGVDELQKKVDEKKTKERHLKEEAERIKREEEALKESNRKSQEDAIARIEVVEQERQYMRERLSYEKQILAEENEKYKAEQERLLSERSEVEEERIRLLQEDRKREQIRSDIEAAKDRLRQEESELEKKAHLRREEIAELEARKYELREAEQSVNNTRNAYEEKLAMLEREQALQREKTRRIEEENQRLLAQREKIRQEQDMFRLQWQRLEEEKRRQEEWRLELLQQQNEQASQGAAVAEAGVRNRKKKGRWGIFNKTKKRDLSKRQGKPPPKTPALPNNHSTFSKPPPKTPARPFQNMAINQAPPPKTPGISPPGSNISSVVPPKTPAMPQTQAVDAIDPNAIPRPWRDGEMEADGEFQWGATPQTVRPAGISMPKTPGMPPPSKTLTKKLSKQKIAASQSTRPPPKTPGMPPPGSNISSVVPPKTPAMPQTQAVDAIDPNAIPRPWRDGEMEADGEFQWGATPQTVRPAGISMPKTPGMPPPSKTLTKKLSKKKMAAPQSTRPQKPQRIAVPKTPGMPPSGESSGFGESGHQARMPPKTPGMPPASILPSYVGSKPPRKKLNLQNANTSSVSGGLVPRTPALMPKTPGVAESLMAIALYDRTESDCTDADDLSFSEGDLLQVLEQDGDWWLCKIQGSMRSGLVPANFVEIVKDKGFTVGAPINLEASNIVTATALFGREKSDCVDPDDLTFNAGDRLQVLENNGEWWLCRLLGSNGSAGLVPSNYVQLDQRSGSNIKLMPKTPAMMPKTPAMVSEIRRGRRKSLDSDDEDW